MCIFKGLVRGLVWAEALITTPSKPFRTQMYGDGPIRGSPHIPNSPKSAFGGTASERKGFKGCRGGLEWWIGAWRAFKTR